MWCLEEIDSKVVCWRLNKWNLFSFRNVNMSGIQIVTAIDYCWVITFVKHRKVDRTASFHKCYLFYIIYSSTLWNYFRISCHRIIVIALLVKHLNKYYIYPKYISDNEQAGGNTTWYKDDWKQNNSTFRSFASMNVYLIWWPNLIVSTFFSISDS